MRSTKFWIMLTASLLAVSILASALVLCSRGGTTAVVMQNGKVMETIDLSKVRKPYTLIVSGPAGTNTVEVDHGRIRVSHPDCPDQVCVFQGWISEGIIPIVCLPNGLVIEIEEGPHSGIDGVAG